VTITLKVPGGTRELFYKTMERMPGADEAVKFAELLARVPSE
jgi:hypothetical protein